MERKFPQYMFLPCFPFKLKIFQINQHICQLKLCNDKLEQWSLQGRVSRREPTVHCDRRSKAVVNNHLPTKERIKRSLIFVEMAGF